MTSYIGLVLFPSGVAFAHVTTDDTIVSLGKLRCGGVRSGSWESRVQNMLDEACTK